MAVVKLKSPKNGEDASSSVRDGMGGFRPRGPHRTSHAVIGRPTVLTRELIAEFERVLPLVAFMETAGDLLGIIRQQWRLWLRLGKTELDRRMRDPLYTPNRTRDIHIEFFFAFKRGVAKYAERHLSSIADAAPRYWGAAAWLMERGPLADKWGDHAKELADMKKQLATLIKTLEEVNRPVSAGMAPPKPSVEG